MTASPLPRDPDRDLDLAEVLGRAIPLYWMFGRADVPLAVLAAETGAGEMALARAFGDAPGAFRAALAQYVEGPAAEPYRAFAAAPDGQEAAVFSTALLDLVFDGDTGRGCLLIQAIAAFAPRDPQVDSAVKGHVAALAALAGPLREARPAPRQLLAAHAAAAARAREGLGRDAVAQVIERLVFAPL